MLILAQTQEDRAVIAAHFEKLDISNPPDPVHFVRAFILDNPDSQLRTGVSQATQAAIAAELGIEPAFTSSCHRRRRQCSVRTRLRGRDLCG